MRPRMPEELYVLEKDGKSVFVDKRTGTWIRTNHVGCAIILQCNGTRETGEIVSSVAETYRVPVDLIRQEVEDFIKSAIKEGALIGDDPSTSPAEAFQGPNIIWLHVTRRCNLNCVHCYAGGDVHSGNEFSITEINETLAQIAEIGSYLVYVTGGEPLMRSDLWQVEPQGLRLRLVTNGTLVNENNYRMIAEKFPEVQVSIDGPDAATHERLRHKGSFETSLNAIRLLSQVHLDRRIVSCTATKLNRQRIPEMVQWAYDLGWSLYLNRLIPIGNATLDHYLKPEEYDGLVEDCYQAYSRITKAKGKPPLPFFFQPACSPVSRVLLRNRRSSCGMGGSIISIDAGGDAFPCPLLHLPELKIGNVKECTLREVVKKARTIFTDLTVERLDNCRDCYIKHICGGGCRALAYHSGYGLAGKDPYCTVTKKSIESAFWL
jgi:radical SAM protein with 4Fe4S-binding SPASM domain